MYSSLSDLKALQSEDVLLQLSDDNDAGVFVIVVPFNQPYIALLQAITDADTIINSYVSGRYSVPIAEPVPAIVKQISANLALCNLYGRRREMDMPEGIAARRKDFMKLLLDIKTERADIPELSSVIIAPAAFLVSKSDSDQVFNDDLLSMM